MLEHRAVEHDIGLKKAGETLRSLQVAILDSEVEERSRRTDTEEHLRSGSSMSPRLGSSENSDAQLPGSPRATSLLEGRRQYGCGGDIDEAVIGSREQEHTAQLRHTMKATGSSTSAEVAEKIESYPILSHWERAGDHVSYPVERSVSYPAL